MTYPCSVKVTWDDAKNLANQEKHELAFEDAAELFSSGADYLEIYDEQHSDEEERFSPSDPSGAGSSSSSGLSRTRRRSASSAHAGQPSASRRSSTSTWSGTDD
jgi:hypothetical protein